MIPQQIDKLLDKINELKALSIFGQRVIPFLEELFNFVQEIIPLLDEINHSISESTAKIPGVSSQLNKVNQATEIAATEIFDTVDTILLRLGEMNSEHTRNAGSLKTVMRIDGQISRLLKDGLKGQNDALLAEINKLQNEKLQKQNEILDFYNNTISELDIVHESASDIMMYMQVQDITSQQIAAVNHLISSVEKKLGVLVGRLNEQNKDPEKGHENIPKAFDSDALFAASELRQVKVDTLVNKHQVNKDETSLISQDDIDRLFRIIKKSGESGLLDDGSAIDRFINKATKAKRPAKSSGKSENTAPDEQADDTHK